MNKPLAAAKSVLTGIRELFIFALEQLTYQRQVNTIRAVSTDELKAKTDVEIVEMALEQYAQVRAYGIDSNDKLHEILRNSVISEKKSRKVV